MATGKFITFEGGEGAGKSTQAALLRDRLMKAGLRVVLTREPGGTPRAEGIREALLSGRVKPLGPLAETVLFYVARDSHLELTIRPALARGSWVVCDRFFDSTRAYQGAAGGVSLAVLDGLERAVVAHTRPDLTVMLDLPAEEGLRRAGLRAAAEAGARDRFETMNLLFHANLRQEFLDIAAAEPRRCVVVDAARPVDEVAAAVWTAVKQRLPGLA
ncbi:MAG: dTMP kinase [Hyphomicrobiales bacterium]|nr:dTMP kinase [Hyphomicrobiales bacterium]